MCVRERERERERETERERERMEDFETCLAADLFQWNSSHIPTHKQRQTETQKDRQSGAQARKVSQSGSYCV